MDTETLDAKDDVEPVDLAIYDYHVAVERGETPDPKAWTARHPEIADELTAYFEDLRALNLLQPPPAEAPEGKWTLIGGCDCKPGDTLGGYVLLEELGRGGQGVVWKAGLEREPDIVVALKTLPGPSFSNPAAIYSLREDVRAIASMRHPNIIQTSYFGEDRGRWFFVMELMEGGTVAERLESYQADLRSAVVLLEKVARAIHHAHFRNPRVLHLDLKPGNILLTAAGEPKVTDFGMSLRLKTLAPPEIGTTSSMPVGPDIPEDLAATISRLGIRGTIPYISPEMAAGLRVSEVSPSSDIYGLGAVLYAMLAGRPPFRGKDQTETLALVREGRLTPPRELNRRVDRELNAVCLKCLDRDPRKRYGSADALANDLRRWLEVRPTLAGGKPSAGRELWFWMRRNPRGVALAAVAAVGLWLAGMVNTLAGLRVENAHHANRLAVQVDRELRLIRRATQILATDPRLRSAFSSSAADQGGSHRSAIECYLNKAVNKENLFAIPGGNPFANVFVLGEDGVLLADTLEASPAVGKTFRVRDYYRAFIENDWPSDYVYVARSFESVKDRHYKIAVSTRIRDDRGNLLGYLVANFTIGPRLIDVDLRQETNASVVCPMDRSDPRMPGEGPAQAWQYVSVLDARYPSDTKKEPITMGMARLRDFQDHARLVQSSEGPGGGKLVNYHRVGETHMVVVTMRTCPWPLSWLP